MSSGAILWKVVIAILVNQEHGSAGLDAAQTLAGHADPKTTRRAYARVQKGRVLRGLASVLDLGAVGAYAGKGIA